jgi:hypothetical protein
MLACPSEFSVGLAGTECRHPESYSSDRLLAQSFWPSAVWPVLVKPSHYAVSHFLGCVVFPQGASAATVKFPTESSLEFGLRLEPNEPNLANQPQPISSSLGLLLPTAHEGSKVHFSRARPPALFRLQGLATLLTAYALRPRASFISHRQRSWDSPFGAFSSRKIPGPLHPDDPTCHFARRCSHRTRLWAGPDRPQLLGSCLPRVPGDATGF